MGGYPAEPRPDHDYYADTDEECGNCGGEGFTYHCIDGCCINAEDGCELCASRCDWCNPPKPKQRDTELDKVLSDALDT